MPRSASRRGLVRPQRAARRAAALRPPPGGLPRAARCASCCIACAALRVELQRALGRRASPAPCALSPCAPCRATKWLATASSSSASARRAAASASSSRPVSRSRSLSRTCGDEMLRVELERAAVGGLGFVQALLALARFAERRVERRDPAAALERLAQQRLRGRRVAALQVQLRRAPPARAARPHAAPRVGGHRLLGAFAAASARASCSCSAASPGELSLRAARGAERFLHLPVAQQRVAEHAQRRDVARVGLERALRDLGRVARVAGARWACELGERGALRRSSVRQQRSAPALPQAHATARAAARGAPRSAGRACGRPRRGWRGPRRGRGAGAARAGSTRPRLRARLWRSARCRDRSTPRRTPDAGAARGGRRRWRRSAGRGPAARCRARCDTRRRGRRARSPGAARLRPASSLPARRCTAPRMCSASAACGGVADAWRASASASSRRSSERQWRARRTSSRATARRFVASRVRRTETG